jgi:hypothetical protein
MSDFISHSLMLGDAAAAVFPSARMSPPRAAKDSVQPPDQYRKPVICLPDSDEFAL